jgi:hypothetical protein
MNPSFLMAYLEGGFIRKYMSLITLAGGLCLFAIMTAEGCVKRPNLDPAPGVSTWTIVSERL